MIQGITARWHSLTQEQTVAIELEDGWQSGTVVSTKRAREVELNIRCLSAGSITGLQAVICILPNELRPQRNVYFIVSNMDAGSGIGTGILTIDTNGYVVNQASLASTRWVQGTVSYFVG